MIKYLKNKIKTISEVGFSALSNFVHRNANRLSDYFLSNQEFIHFRSNGFIFIGFGSTAFHRHIAIKGTYEPMTVAAMQYFGEDKIVIDVGANIGYHSIMVSSIAKQVFLFEPVSRSASLVQYNININNIFNLSFYQLGLSDVSGKSNIHLATSSGHSSLVKNYGEGGEVIETRRFDELDLNFSPEDVGVVKIDVEGFELNVLRGMSRLISTSSIKFIIEFNPNWICFDDLKTIFGNRKYYVIDEHNRKVRSMVSAPNHPVNLLVV